MKILMVFICTVLLGACAYAPVPPSMQYRVQTQPQPRPDAALVYFYNETHATGFTQAASPYVILEGGEDGRPIATLGRDCWKCVNQTYTWIYMPAGQHTLTAMFRNGHGTGISLPVTLDAGQTYYYRVVQRPAWWSQDIVIEPVAREDALRGLPSYMNCHGGACG